MIPGKHFRDELENECLTFEQARSVLRGGRIYSETEQDRKTAEWTYRVEGWEPGWEMARYRILFQVGQSCVFNYDFFDQTEVEEELRNP